MTRQEVYEQCLKSLDTTPSLLLQLPTGFGKSKLAIDLINYLCDTKYSKQGTTMLLLVAKVVHKQTWKEEFEKWGGIKVSSVTIECYESMHKHTGKKFTFLLMDEVHHAKSEARIECLNYIQCNHMLGLSATVPRDLAFYLKRTYKAQSIKCTTSEAIDNAILPEPQIMLYPISLENTKVSETIEIGTKHKTPIKYGVFADLWKCKREKVHAILSCTQQQKYNELSSLIQWEKDTYMRNRSKALEQTWLYHCGKRLEYLSDCKIPFVQAILAKIQGQRSITFCKTIPQTDRLGENCIHSKNKRSEKIYNDFNAKLIDNITAVNILNENANLVDCKYAIFTNLSSSDLVMIQRIGRALRHPSPVIIIPYFKGTREQEIVENLLEGFNKDYVKVINSIDEI